MNIKSKDIKRYVYLKLGKKETEEVNNEELNKITFLNLNYKNFKDEIKLFNGYIVWAIDGNNFEIPNIIKTKTR